MGVARPAFSVISLASVVNPFGGSKQTGAAGDETCFLRNEPNFSSEARICLRRSRYWTRASAARLRA